MFRTNRTVLFRLVGMVALAVILVCVGVSHAQTDAFGFDGRIIVPDPHFDYPPIEIRLFRDEVDGRTIAYTFTEGTGSYAFKGLTEGTYFVAVHLDGYQDVRQRVDMTARVGFLMRGVNIIMKPVTPDLYPGASLSREDREAMDSFGKAITERSKGRSDKAATLLESAVRLVPEFPDAHAKLREVYQELHRRVDAEREFRIAHDLKPGELRTLLNLGRLYLEEAEVQIATGANHNVIRPLIGRASSLLRDAVIRYPDSALAGYLLGSAYFRSASHDSAESELKRALSLDKGMFPARLMLVNVYVIQQKWQSALDTLDRFMLENPSSPYVKETRAIREGVVRRLPPTP